MSKQEATNTFSDGLIMDLNPLNTPDNVLTDCLNGTILTYNGNEFILQNDQGNFKLENAKLNPNFIPVGITEYADTIYIVSHNPITSETEIGSYPSPRRIFTTKDNQHVVNFEPIIPNNVTNLMSNTYEEFMKKSKLKIYTLSNDNDSFILNPGDEFKLKLNENMDFKYQEIKFAIFSLEKELFDLDIPKEYINQNDFKKVFWKIPGWLTGRYRIANIDTFNLNILQVPIPDFSLDGTFPLSFSLNTQIGITDDLFLKNVDSLINDLQVHLTINVKSEKSTRSYNFKSTKLNRHRYGNVNNVFFYNFLENELNFNDIRSSDVITISAVPVLKVDNVEIIYDQFRTQIELNLASVSDANDIIIAKNTFKYLTDDEGVTVYFDMFGPFRPTSSVKVKYNIYNLDNTNNYLPILKDIVIPDINLIGQNIIRIPFTDSFKKEDIFLLSFKVTQDEQLIRVVNKLFITSELFNNFFYTKNEFNSQISSYDWLSKYKDTISFDEFSTLKIDTDSVSYTELRTHDGIWPKTWLIQQSEQINKIEYEASISTNFNLKLNAKFNKLSGNLWNNANNSFKLEFILNNSNFSRVLNINNLSNLTWPINNIKLFKNYLINTIKLPNQINVPNYTAEYIAEAYRQHGLAYNGNYFLEATGIGYSGNRNFTSTSSLIGYGSLDDMLYNNNPIKQPILTQTHNDTNGYGDTNKVIQNSAVIMNNLGVPFLIGRMDKPTPEPWDIIAEGGKDWKFSSANTPWYFIRARSADTIVKNMSVWVNNNSTKWNSMAAGSEGLKKTLDAFNQMINHVFVATGFRSPTSKYQYIPSNIKTSVSNSVNIHNINLTGLVNSPIYNYFNLNSNLHTEDGLLSIKNRIIEIESKIDNINKSTINLFNFEYVQNLQNLHQLLTTISLNDIYNILYDFEESSESIKFYENIRSTFDLKIIESNREVKAVITNPVTGNGIYHDMRKYENVPDEIIQQYDWFIGQLTFNSTDKSVKNLIIRKTHNHRNIRLDVNGVGGWVGRWINEVFLPDYYKIDKNE